MEQGNGNCFKVVSRLADHGIVRRDGGNCFRLTTLGDAVIRKVSKGDKARPRSLPKDDKKSSAISIEDDDDDDDDHDHGGGGDEPELDLSNRKLPSFSEQLDWATKESLSVTTLESSQIEQAKRRSLSDGGFGSFPGAGSGQNTIRLVCLH
jgi:hypothetical protein